MKFAQTNNAENVTNTFTFALPQYGQPIQWEGDDYTVKIVKSYLDIENDLIIEIKAKWVDPRKQKETK